jgi:hypothetical protein
MVSCIFAYERLSHFLKQMTEGTMPNVMNESCNSKGCSFVFIDDLFGGILINALRHTDRQMVCTQGMRKSAVFGARIGQASQAQLSNAPKSLKRWRLHELQYNWAFNSNEIVDWISYVFDFGHDVPEEILRS